MSHAVDGDKPEKLDNLFEIDLSTLTEDTVSDLEKLKEAVLVSAPRKWYRCSLYDDLNKVGKLRKSLQERLVTEKEKTLKERTIKEAELKREADIEKNKSRMREHYAEPLKNLDYMLTSGGITARHELLTNDPRYHKTKRWIEKKLAPFENTMRHTPQIINIPLKGDWTFNAHPLVWQAFVLFGIVFKRPPGFTLHASWVLKEVEKRYDILPWVATLDKLKRSQKKQGRERKQWYADEGAWFLEHEENQSIISPYRVVIEYLIALSKPQIGILSRVNDSPRFTIKLAPFDDFASLQEQRAEESTLRMERLLEQQVQDEKQQQLKEQEKQMKRDQRDADAKRCAGNLEAMFHAGASQASFCPCCRAAFNAVVTKCSECGKRQMRTLALDESELETLYHRIRSYPCLNNRP